MQHMHVVRSSMQSIITGDENGVCRVVTANIGKALRRGETKMAQIVAWTNEQPQSAKKYEQRYLFPPRCAIRAGRGRTVSARTICRNWHGRASTATVSTLWHIAVQTINKKDFILDYLPARWKNPRSPVGQLVRVNQSSHFSVITCK